MSQKNKNNVLLKNAIYWTIVAIGGFILFYLVNKEMNECISIRKSTEMKDEITIFMANLIFAFLASVSGGLFILYGFIAKYIYDFVFYRFRGKE